jgi:diphosphomevalonate decarboxylase
MSTSTVTAVGFANIAFIKYWGNRDQKLRLPVNGSISMNLAGLYARTQVTFDPQLCCDDILTLNGRVENEAVLRRVSSFLDRVREMAGSKLFARVVSENNFPIGTGIASSAAAFAALALAATRAVGLELSEPDLSRLARRGSGSACRSVPGGFVEWQVGTREEDSFAFSIAPANHWDLVDCVAVLKVGHKPVGSTEGHTLAGTSPLQASRVADTTRRLDICRQAVLHKDFAALAEIIEQDSNMMHAVMMTSTPALFYWEPASLELMQAVRAWRKEGIPAAYTLDAGPNVHVICEAGASDLVCQRLYDIPAVRQLLVARPGGPAQIETNAPPISSSPESGSAA